MWAEVGGGGCKVLWIRGWAPGCRGIGGGYGELACSHIRGPAPFDRSWLALGGVYSRVLHAHEAIDNHLLGQLPYVKHRRGESGPR